MSDVRIGLIGYGTMGTVHAKYLSAGRVPGAALAAVCDLSSDNLGRAKKNLGEAVSFFGDTKEFFASAGVEAVIIATPHYFHPELAIEAFSHDLHVLIEKPAGVYTGQVRQMNEAAAAAGKVFGIMFHLRTRPIFKKLKDIVASGELGEIQRITWIATDWFRPQAYYDSSLWRATWKGEGGGVLINQCAHQLDLWQWICGLPKRVRGFCAFGKYHELEVEDDVTAYVEYANGATGTFITSTGEAPGTNRLEIAGDNGMVVLENDTLTFWRTRVSVRQFSRETDDGFSTPECWKCQIPVSTVAERHETVTRGWIDAIRDGGEPIVDGAEGIRSIELSNAILLSTWTDGWVDIPVDEDLFHEQLDERIRTSTIKKKPPDKTKVMDVTKTF